MSTCQVKRNTTNDHCSYINNDLVGYFYGKSNDEVWRGGLKNPEADIIVTLISKNQKTKSLLIGVAESVRPKS
ncbi:hypothetical protein D3C86_2172610 [compost metagenome]